MSCWAHLFLGHARERVALERAQNTQRRGLESPERRLKGRVYRPGPVANQLAVVEVAFEHNQMCAGQIPARAARSEGGKVSGCAMEWRRKREQMKGRRAAAPSPTRDLRVEIRRGLRHLVKVARAGPKGVLPGRGRVATEAVLHGDAAALSPRPDPHTALYSHTPASRYACHVLDSAFDASTKRGRGRLGGEG